MISKIKDGRASVCPTGEEDFLIPCQTLIVAIGQDIESEHFAEAGVPVSRGKIMNVMAVSITSLVYSPVETVHPDLLP